MNNFIQICGDTMNISFQDFSLPNYELFIKSKSLPESALRYDHRASSYQLSAPARFAKMLGVTSVPRTVNPLPFNQRLLDRQEYAVRLALAAKRYAVWMDTGLGKTLIYLEWARQVRHITGGRILLIVPLNVIPDALEQAACFYPDMEIITLTNREDMRHWCKNGAPGLAITNPAKFIPPDKLQEFVPEIQFLSGVVLDESSILKTGAGVIKWALIKSCRGIEYKLSLTATPAPNDSMEYASQASFLEKIRNEGDILWTYFTKTKDGEWKIKDHAKAGFYRFLAGWSIYMRDPKVFGFKDDLKDLPPADIKEYKIAITDEQRAMVKNVEDTHGQKGLFIKAEGLGITERGKYSQLAKGFLYANNRKTIHRLNSLKPAMVADLAKEDLQDNRQVIIWTVFDAEADIIKEHLADIDGVGCISGSTSSPRRRHIIEEFRQGSIRILISKASLLGFGLNLQHCSSMIFSGFDDSFERFYQAMRRAYRYGQTKQVRVHIPYIPELEGVVWANVKQKENRIFAEIHQQELSYRQAMKELLI